jgi:hypothetical protein
MDDSIQERKQKRNTLQGELWSTAHSRSPAAGPPRGCSGAFRVREFSPARHLGERGEAARGNQSGPRLHAGTAVRWAAGADLAALRGTRCCPTNLKASRNRSVRFSEWDRSALANAAGRAEKSGENFGQSPVSAVGRARRRRVSRARRPAGGFGARTGVCSRPKRKLFEPAEMPVRERSCSCSRWLFRASITVGGKPAES